MVVRSTDRCERSDAIELRVGLSVALIIDSVAAVLY